MDKRKPITREYIIGNNEREIRYTIFRKDCKRLCISVTPQLDVRITAPLDAPDSFINDALREKTPWIIKSVDRLKNCTILPFPEKYISGEKIAYLGREINLKVLQGAGKKVELSGDTLVVRVPAPDMKNVKREVDKWLRHQAEIVFSRYLNKCYSVISGYCLSEPFLKIRKMKSRWGSCSRAGKVTLNLRLIHLPGVCIEYIVMHELCHLKHLNHSQSFYSFLQHCMPDWKERKSILESYRLSI